MKFILREFESYLQLEKGLSENTIKSYLKDLQQYTSHLSKYYDVDNPEKIEKDILKIFADITPQKVITKNNSKKN